MQTEVHTVAMYVYSYVHTYVRMCMCVLMHMYTDTFMQNVNVLT